MRCKKCNGFMVKRTFLDYENLSEIEVKGYACCSCGRVVFIKPKKNEIFIDLKLEE